MKKLLVVLATMFIFCGCSKDDDNAPQINPTPSTNVYYVKYEVKMLVPSNFKMSVTYTTEKGQKSISTASSTWEGTYGPFKSGQKVTVSASTAKSTRISTNYARIYVSTNNSPFSIKSEQNADRNEDISTTYILP